MLIPGTGDGSHPRDPAAVRIRPAAAGAAVVTVGAGLGLRAVAADGVAKYGGDALYTVLLLALVVLAAPHWTPLRAAGTALAASWAVELFQLSPVPAELSRHSVAARLVLGSTFNAPDLFWYAVGAAVGGVLHAAMGRRRRTPAAGDTPHT
ncbi:ribosomal maturation YjgA family protein [Streptomyces virginiae]|uniref:ribosomal maturation YjgA family protein n=1 Tax=Streptomyces virginiae TaxID=1961 RepID=UPI00364C8163